MIKVAVILVLVTFTGLNISPGWFQGRNMRRIVTDVPEVNHLVADLNGIENSEVDDDGSRWTTRLSHSSTPYERKLCPVMVYVHALPDQFNKDLIRCIYSTYPDKCMRMDYEGLGLALYNKSGLAVHHTWQFSLEVILHHRLLQTACRTKDPDIADVFFIPYYSALACFCNRPFGNTSNSVQSLLNYMKTNTYYNSGRPHVMAQGKIEKEHSSPNCPLLKYPDTRNITFIGIEQALRTTSRKTWPGANNKLIVAPYPSYGHLQLYNLHIYLRQLYSNPRPVKVFMAAGSRQSNPVRAGLLEQFSGHSTDLGYAEYNANGSNRSHVWLVTPECRYDHHNLTIDWMQKSVFCLQPPGDSPTRKSFYDAIIAGCIPVIFPPASHVYYPFESEINYDNLTVQIPENILSTNVKEILPTLAKIPTEEITAKQLYIQNVIHKLQYSPPNDDHSERFDALYMILQQLEYRFIGKKQ